MKESATTPSLKEENVTYTDNGVAMNGYLVYDANKKGKRPGIISSCMNGGGLMIILENACKKIS